MRLKHSAGKQFNPKNTLMRNLFLARFGDTVWTERQQAFLILVMWFANVADLKRRLPTNSMTEAERRYVENSELEFDKVTRPILLRALLDQDPEPFRDFVTVLEAMRRRKGEPVHPLQSLLVERELRKILGGQVTSLGC